MTETHRLRDLAELVSQKTGAEIEERYVHRCDTTKIPATSLWRPHEREVAQQPGGGS